MPDVTIGQLRHCLTLQRQTSVPDGMGGSERQWVAVANVYADIQPLSGREYIQAQQMQSAVTHRLTIRYRDNLTASYRLYSPTRVFNISAVLDDGLRHWLTLLCTEVRNDG